MAPEGVLKGISHRAVGKTWHQVFGPAHRKKRLQQVVPQVPERS